jgi:hypothetical protein
MADQPDRVLEAFRRLLAEGSEGGQAKVDALVALSQRTVLVPLWTANDPGFRTLVNSTGQTALPVFTGKDQLDAAAVHFGWRQPDGSVPANEVGARQALRHAVAHDLPYVVVDIVGEHALEIERSELEPLLSPDSKRGSGPYAAVGRITSSMLQAVKPTPPPQASADTEHADPAVPPPPAPPQETKAAPAPDHSETPAAGTAEEATSSGAGAAPGITASSEFQPVPAGDGSATFGSGSSVRIEPPSEQPADELLDALDQVLRDYPEIEWASFCSAARGPAGALPTVGVRVDTSFRQRVGEIIERVRKAGDAAGATLDVLLLDAPEQMRAARDALVFYPWRR